MSSADPRAITATYSEGGGFVLDPRWGWWTKVDPEEDMSAGEATIGGTEELKIRARRAALATVHVNHPGAAYKLMRDLAEYTLDLLVALKIEEAAYEKERKAHAKSKEFLKATAATLVAERRSG